MFDDYLRATQKAGSTPNGVFAARIMWGSIEEVFYSQPTRTTSKEIASDRAKLESLFGPLKFIQLRRDDHVAQAVSLFIAEHTNVWHKTRADAEQGSETPPTYDFSAIHELVTEIKAHENSLAPVVCGKRH